MGLSTNDISKADSSANKLLDRVESIQEKGVPISLDKETISYTGKWLIGVAITYALLIFGAFYFLFNKFFGNKNQYGSN